ncbi:MAG TPA: stage V sporulation protein AE [Clostridiales bacterium]|nr:stage V sporulation protein AE [Eubacteriales bacterium]HBR30573.1 stage V sporulation protein AE [Clostridiales bacterium]
MKLNDYLYSFLVGGALCVIAQIFIDKTKVTAARILVTYVVLGVVLTALGLYQPLIDFAKSGATVPLTGFGYLLAKGVEKAVKEDGFFGVLYGGLKATAAGISASFSFALIWSILFKSKEK